MSSRNKYIPPWKQMGLSEWSIIGMNHYHVAREKFLFVCLGKKLRDGTQVYIKEEGRDDVFLWNRLIASSEKYE